MEGRTGVREGTEHAQALSSFSFAGEFRHIGD